MTSPYRDLDRPPLRVAALRRGLAVPDALWTDLRVLDECPSTNAEVAEAAREGAAEGLVVIAERQSAGRGRRDRTWESPLRAGLTFSILLRPSFPRPQWGWLPLTLGLACADAVSRVAEVDVALKWPNDLLVDERKLGGLLAEIVGDAVVVGVGLNVSLAADELPVPEATSLSLEGAPTDRDPLLRAMLRAIGTRYVALSSGDFDEVAAAYRARCSTLGGRVRVELPGGHHLDGRAVDVDASGRLVVETGDGPHAVEAGDVVHVR